MSEKHLIWLLKLDLESARVRLREDYKFTLGRSLIKMFTPLANYIIGSLMTIYKSVMVLLREKEREGKLRRSKQMIVSHLDK